MDSLDLAIYRWLSPGGEARFWAGRRIIDATVPARAIAERVGVSENGVRVRLRRLAQQGYLRGKYLIPNPSLFGVRVFVLELPINEASEVERVYRDLALVEGVVFARDTLDEGNRAIRVHFVSESDTVTARRAALLRRLAPSGPPAAPQPYWIPGCERPLTRLDWRILETVFGHPNASVTEIARARKISTKTTARRLHQFVGSRTCWWTHGADSEEFPLALVRVEGRDPAHRESVAGGVSQGITDWMPVASDGLGLEPATTATWIAGLVPADAPAALERTVQRLLSIPGVVSVRRTFALSSRMYPEWFAGRISDHADPGT
jgi:DNA-binding Lrp family transcriptional regulator